MAVALTLLGIIPFQGDRVGWSFARDLYAYWIADPADPYANSVGVGFAYLYSPLFLQIFLPLKLIPFEILAVLWLGAGLASLWWLRALWMLVIPGVSSDLLLGNINVFLAVAIVLALRSPALWMAVLLTKLSPAVGVLWHVVRHEWAALARAFGIASAVVILSIAVQPDAWADWINVLAQSLEQRGASTSEFGPLALRLPAAIALVLVGAVTRRAWALPVAALVAMPVVWPATLAVLTAIPRLREYGKNDVLPHEAE